MADAKPTSLTPLSAPLFAAWFQKAKAAAQASELHYNFNCIMQSCEQLTGALHVIDDIAIAGVAVRDENKRSAHARAHAAPTTAARTAEAVVATAGSSSAATDTASRAVVDATSTSSSSSSSNDSGGGRAVAPGQQAVVADEQTPSSDANSTGAVAPTAAATAATGEGDKNSSQPEPDTRDAAATSDGDPNTTTTTTTATASGATSEGAVTGDGQSDVDGGADVPWATAGDASTFFKSAQPSFMQFASYSAKEQGAVGTVVFLDACR